MNPEAYLPLFEGNAAVPGAQERLVIRRDQYGIPHIEARNDHDAWLGMSTYVMVYERFREDPEAVVSEVAGSMGLRCDPTKILEKFGRPPAKKPMSITREWVELIESEFGDWLSRYGYETPGEFKFKAVRS